MIFGVIYKVGFSERDWEIGERFVWWMGVAWEFVGWEFVCTQTHTKPYK